MARVAIIYYSATGNVRRLAHAVEEGAQAAGAETRDEPEASLDDLEWADAYVFGTPTRFGNVLSQLKQFLDTAGGLWAEGKLADKAVSGFTIAQNPHGGQESTLLALFNTMYYWGAIVVTPGYTDDRVFPAGGNPYGASSSLEPAEADLGAARHLGERVASLAGRLAMAGTAAG